MLHLRLSTPGRFVSVVKDWRQVVDIVIVTYEEKHSRQSTRRVRCLVACHLCISGYQVEENISVWPKNVVRADMVDRIEGEVLIQQVVLH